MDRRRLTAITCVGIVTLGVAIATTVSVSDRLILADRSGTPIPSAPVFAASASRVSVAEAATPTPTPVPPADDASPAPTESAPPAERPAADVSGVADSAPEVVSVPEPVEVSPPADTTPAPVTPSPTPRDASGTRPVPTSPPERETWRAPTDSERDALMRALRDRDEAALRAWAEQHGWSLRDLRQWIERASSDSRERRDSDDRRHERHDVRTNPSSRDAPRGVVPGDPKNPPSDHRTREEQSPIPPDVRD